MNVPQMSLSGPTLDIELNSVDVIGVCKELYELRDTFLKGVVGVNKMMRNADSSIWMVSEEEENMTDREFLSVLFHSSACREEGKCLVVVLSREKLRLLAGREICATLYIPDSMDVPYGFHPRISQQSSVFNMLSSFSVHGIFPIVRGKYSESEYISLISRIVDSEEPLLDNRTNTKTKSLIAQRAEYDILGVFPAITHRRLFFKGVVEELLWFLRGSTDTHELSKRGIKFWDANSTREFLDNRGLVDYPEGQLGKSYGYQWRHSGGEWSPDNEHTSGVDQIKKLVEGIKKDPHSRRHIINNWIPSDIEEIALPPCHVMAQFIVKDNLLSCVLIQRSADIVLGVPFNVACYTVLTYIVASATNLVPDKLYHIMNDCHIYENHIKPMQETKIEMYKPPFLSSIPRDFAESLLMDKNVGASHKDFSLRQYKCGPAMKLTMAV